MLRWMARRSEHGAARARWRVLRAWQMVMEQAAAKGIPVTLSTRVVHAADDGRLVTSTGAFVGQPDARILWCTGYKPNTDYLGDSRTDRCIADCLDAAGFVRVTRTHALAKPELGHIFAGGDLAFAAAHTYGERTADMAGLHACVIVQNILRLAGKREGALKIAAINRNKNIDGLAVPLGVETGLLWATDPAFEPFFATADECRKKFGELKDAGAEGWRELNPGVQYLRYDMFPGMMAKMFLEDDMAVTDQFWSPHVVDEVHSARNRRISTDL